MDTTTPFTGPTISTTEEYGIFKSQINGDIAGLTVIILGVLSVVCLFVITFLICARRHRAKQKDTKQINIVKNGSFVKDRDFSYVDLEESSVRTSHGKMSRQVEHYNSVDVDAIRYYNNSSVGKLKHNMQSQKKTNNVGTENARNTDKVVSQSSLMKATHTKSGKMSVQNVQQNNIHKVTTKRSHANIKTVSAPQHAKSVPTVSATQHAKNVPTVSAPQHAKRIPTVSAPHHANSVPIVSAPQHAKRIPTVSEPHHANSVATVSAPQHAKSVPIVSAPQNAKNIPEVSTIKYNIGTQSDNRQPHIKEEYISTQQLHNVRVRFSQPPQRRGVHMQIGSSLSVITKPIQSNADPYLNVENTSLRNSPYLQRENQNSKLNHQSNNRSLILLPSYGRSHHLAMDKQDLQAGLHKNRGTGKNNCLAHVSQPDTLGNGISTINSECKSRHIYTDIDDEQNTKRNVDPKNNMSTKNYDRSTPYSNVVNQQRQKEQVFDTNIGIGDKPNVIKSVVFNNINIATPVRYGQNIEITNVDDTIKGHELPTEGASAPLNVHFDGNSIHDLPNGEPLFDVTDGGDILLDSSRIGGHIESGTIKFGDDGYIDDIGDIVFENPYDETSES